MTDRESKEKQEERLFENCLTLECIANGKMDALKPYLEMANLRIKSGMTQNEIELVQARAKEASEKLK
jgi:hypothetical protein